MIELKGTSAIMHMKRSMENSLEGLEILKQRPRINTKTVDINRLRKYPEGTLGKTYVNFLEHNVSQTIGFTIGSYGY